MPLSPIFRLREKVTPEIIELLEATTLGTNGAMYRHLDTSNRIHEADKPLFLSMERNNKVIGNITFCRRGQDWYVRYFAFHSLAQAGQNKKVSDKGNSILKRELSTFFKESFDGQTDGNSVRSMYAYIDPHNDRSKWMSQNFGFSVIRQLVTQSYSRINPKRSSRVRKMNDFGSISDLVEKHYSDHSYFFTAHCAKPPFYILENSSGEIIGCTRVTRVNWKIVRLPGKLGGVLTRCIPWIPFVNKIIRPEKHTFLVPEIVCIRDNDPGLLDELFSAVLAEEGLNLMLWWMDSQDPLYLASKDRIKWGLLHRLIGASPVDVVQRTATGGSLMQDRPIFVTAYDMV